MSQQAVEPNDPTGQAPTGEPEDNNGNPDPNQNPGHPAWKAILDVLPESLHPLVTPELQKWDQGVQNRFKEIREEYNPYKDLISNKVDPQVIQQSLMLSQMINEDPASVVEKMVEHFNLEQFKAAQQAPSTDPLEELDPDLEGLDIESLKKHPAFSEFFKNQEQIMGWIQSQQETEEEQTANQMMQDYLAELHGNVEPGDPNYVAFDDMFVTTMLAAGVDGETAVNKYKEIVNQAVAGVQPPKQTPTPPVVIGGAGNTGSGVPTNEVKLGTLKESEVNDLVTQMLQQAANQDT